MGVGAQNSISNSVKKFYFQLILMRFSPNDPYDKFNNSDTIFEDNMSRNGHLSSHITVSSILLCPGLYCVRHIIVSSKILCPYLPKVHLFTFHMLHVMVVCCACQASVLCICLDFDWLNDWKVHKVQWKIFYVYSGREHINDGRWWMKPAFY